MLDPDESLTHQVIRDAVEALPQKTAMRSRDMAARIGISEAELIAATAGPSGRQVAKRLPDAAFAIVERLPSLGQVMALTRNEAAVHEKIGTYGNLEGDGQVAGVYGDQIDLRLFLRNWRFGFALEEPNPESALPKRSLQFFDVSGHAVHKVHLRPESDHAAFERLVTDMATVAWEDDLAVEPQPQKRSHRQHDVTGLRMAWRELQNVHDFHLLLRRFEIDRLDALRTVGPEFAYDTDLTAHRGLLETVAARDLPIMVFVNNRGCTQIHNGPIRELRGMGAWWNILDPGFNLHLKEDEIGSSWVVKKPTERGQITSYEIFDHEEQLVLTLFGRREKGQPENPVWRELVESIASKEAG